ncbi:MAG: 3-phosphoserine/phosphohydroxythreonine transaminase [Cytophagia bacterium]|nr:3-phosphoserine/phosphohydroxythreonine transaminase [Cytophagia bacterium]
MKIHNFSAGPAILPRTVLEQASAALLDFNGSGLSLIEVSHRDKDFEGVMHEARAAVKRLLGLGDDFEVLYLQGGASLQFAMVPMNLLRPDGKAAYVNTGTWATKAIEDAQKLGKVQVIASSEDKNFSYLPTGYSIPTDVDYLHITSNNTIYGTQMQSFPDSPVPVVCDMSSDIFSRPIPAPSMGLIYAGAQKNMGPAGTTLVVIRKDLVGQSGRKLNAMLDYGVQIKGQSMYNTPPVFAVYVSMLTLQWIEAQGGLSAMEKRNRAKAGLLYSEIERNTLFKPTVTDGSGSLMNVTFVLHDSKLENIFDGLLREAGISGLKGHRSVGGYRASIYNAMPIESVQVLVEVMQALENQYAS